MLLNSAKSFNSCLLLVSDNIFELLEGLVFHVGGEVAVH